MFIYPVKRGNGHFMLLGQMQDNVLVILFSSSNFEITYFLRPNNSLVDDLFG
jgi:hypothetical protein